MICSKREIAEVEIVSVENVRGEYLITESVVTFRDQQNRILRWKRHFEQQDGRLKIGAKMLISFSKEYQNTLSDLDIQMVRRETEKNKNQKNTCLKL